jgi:hypothetical protein
MSKQLKYKLKKTLKNAEFVHADLEYHQELASDALREFQEEIRQWISRLSDEDKEKLNGLALPPAPVDPVVEPTKTEEDVVDVSDCTELVATGIEVEPEKEARIVTKKSTELKKLFRRIAEHTHPDKVQASGFSVKEVFRMERFFIRAKQAYDDQNWYILYSIALDLDLSIDDPSEEQVKWIEEDIKSTLAQIAAIANLTAWHWYVGDDDARERALKFYFQQVHGFNHPGFEPTG